MLNVWTVRSLIDLGTIDERSTVSIPLPIDYSVQDVSFSVISGNLPPGLRLKETNIIGTPFEVARTERYDFVIRASKNNEISDRTFVIYIQGADEPEWLTPEGSLAVNENGLAFVLDNSLIDFQLSAIDNDLAAGQELEFFIQEGDGELPPGLTLSTSGRITGFVDPILALDVSSGSGFFDTNLYDSYYYDMGVKSNIGYDTFLYETFEFDYTENVRTPKKINRNYEFIVSVSDGETIVKRQFRIYVVGDDFLRSDNTITQAGTGVFTADNTYLRSAVWLTPNNLGVKRANNFVTIFLDTFDANPGVGPLRYEVETTNPGTYRFLNTGTIIYDGHYEISGIFPTDPTTGVQATATSQWSVIVPETVSELPEGINIDPLIGELFGYIPYQPAVTRDYKFTVTAVKYDASALTEVEVTVVVENVAFVGQRFLEISPLPNDDVNLLVGDQIRIGNFYYEVISYQPAPGPNQSARINLSQPLKSDVLSGLIIRNNYIESTIEFNTLRESKTFDLRVIGEVDSVIRYITPSDLGSIRANFPSTLNVRAETSVPNAVLEYTLINGRLPPGTTLSRDGEIIGKVNQFGTENEPGLSVYDNGQTTFDGGFTTIDRSYVFDILAQDQFKYSGIIGRFKIFVRDPDTKLYSNIYVRPFPKESKRQLFLSFITDTNIFTPNKIYRPNDPAFGIQNELKMLLYAGIETKEAKDYIVALAKNTKKKRFKLGNPKKAIAKLPGSDDILYETIYLEVFDEYENNNKSAPSRIKLKRNSNSPVKINQSRINVADGILSTGENLAKLNEDKKRLRPGKETITIDRNSLHVSGRDLEYIYPSSVTNMRNNIAQIGDTENAFLPLWMLTSPDNRTAASGFIKAVPICYCKPGEADFVLQNIVQSGFDFTDLDYEIDRFIIDATTGSNEEKYLKFPVHKYNV